jgi:hypothetical protein
LEDPGIDGRIVLKWICRKWDVRTWPGLMNSKADFKQVVEDVITVSKYVIYLTLHCPSSVICLV